MNNGLAHSHLSANARRLRDLPLDTATLLVEQFGQRASTSLGEAQAAAFLDGRLRRAGLKVSADAFDAAVWNGWDGVVLAVLMASAVMMYRWLPLPALLLMVLGLAGALYRLRRPGQPLLAARAASQNIIGTRALGQRSFKRVVLLAPLDAPPQMPRLLALLHEGDRALVLSVVACAFVLLLGLAGLLLAPYELRIACWFCQIVPLGYLIAAAAADLWLRRAPTSPGAINHAGALAVLLDCAEELTAVTQIELWVVALGSSRTGNGLRDLLRRYPFEPTRTSFITLEGIGAGELTYLTRSGLLLERASDPHLLAQAATVDSEDAAIAAHPRAYRHSPLALSMLREHGWAAIGISCLSARGRPPFHATPDDTADKLDPVMLDRALRLATGIVRKIGEQA